MKRSKAEVARTRRKIVETAVRAFQQHGIDGTGVARIMAEAGLTHGGFYRHFASKDQLLAEAVEANSRSLLDHCQAAAGEGSRAMLELFFDVVEAGAGDDAAACPLAANGSELARADAQTRHVATEGFRRIVDSVAPFTRSRDRGEPVDVSIGILTHLVGALTMARMVDDPALSARIRAVIRRRIADTFPVEGDCADTPRERPAR